MLHWRAVFVLLSVGFCATAISVGSDGPAPLPAHASTGYLQRIGIVLRNAWARQVLLLTFVEGMLVLPAFALLPTYLQGQFSLSPATAAAVTALYGAGGLLYVALAQRHLQGVALERLSVAGGTLLCVGLLAAAWGPAWQWSAMGCMICGVGYYTLHNTLQGHAAQMTPAYRATAISLFAASLFAGQAFGMALASHLMTSVSLDRLFSVAALGMPLLGGVLAWLSSRTTSRSPSTSIESRC